VFTASFLLVSFAGAAPHPLDVTPGNVPSAMLDRRSDPPRQEHRLGPAAVPAIAINPDWAGQLALTAADLSPGPDQPGRGRVCPCRARDVALPAAAGRRPDHPWTNQGLCPDRLVWPWGEQPAATTFTRLHIPPGRSAEPGDTPGHPQQTAALPEPLPPWPDMPESRAHANDQLAPGRGTDLIRTSGYTMYAAEQAASVMPRAVRTGCMPPGAIRPVPEIICPVHSSTASVISAAPGSTSSAAP
jgi:hypothetical protein